ncbi:MAG: hypothetical protein RL292_539 [Candidatus Parcubacteria bacterium]|jgi:hypothetical protein
MSRWEDDHQATMLRQHVVVGLAEEYGHKLGGWQQPPGQENQLASACQNPGCQATVSISTDSRFATYMGPTTLQVLCPYQRKP